MSLTKSNDDTFASFSTVIVHYVIDLDPKSVCN